MPSMPPGRTCAAIRIATPTETASATPITPSSSLDGITVTGDLGSAPTVTVPSPWAIDETRRQVLTPGAGPEAVADSYVEVNYVGVNGRTGPVFDSSWSKGTPGVFSLSHLAIPFPLDDPLYGLQPDTSEDYGANLGAMATRGERGLLVVSIDSLARMSSNPFFDFLMDKVEQGIVPRAQPKP